MSDFLPVLLFDEARAYLFATPLRWCPLRCRSQWRCSSPPLPGARAVAVGSALTLGLVFEVVGSFGIAIAQYADPSRYAIAPPWAGLSWVAVWMLAYTVIVPSPPRRALVAALVSVSSVPIVIGLVMAFSPVVPAMNPVSVLLQPRPAVSARRPPRVCRRARGL
jgi:hypothetical protein